MRELRRWVPPPAKYFQGMPFEYMLGRLQESLAVWLNSELVPYLEDKVRGPDVPENVGRPLVLFTRSGFTFRVSRETVNRYKEEFGANADNRLQAFAEALGEHYTVTRSSQYQLGRMVL